MLWCSWSKVHIFFEKATIFCEIFTLLLYYGVPVKIKVKISQNVVAFSEYTNFKSKQRYFEVSGKGKTDLSIPEIFFIFQWIIRVCFIPLK